MVGSGDGWVGWCGWIVVCVGCIGCWYGDVGVYDVDLFVLDVGWVGICDVCCCVSGWVCEERWDIFKGECVIFLVWGGMEWDYMEWCL